MKHIIQALNAIMKDVSYVQKSSENKFHGYKYASEASLLESLRPAMIQHGLILIPSVGNVSPIDQYGNTMLTVEYTLAHVSGEIWPDKITAVGCGNDKSKSGSVGDKGVYKALTGANKYLLFKLFQIETGDDPEKDEAAPPVQNTQNNAALLGSKKTSETPKPKPKSGPEPIVYEDKFVPTGEDVDKYVNVFIAALLSATTEKEVREFWKQNAVNRAKMALQPNDEEYIHMVEAFASRIAELKDQ